MLIPLIVGILGPILERIIPDPAARQKATIDILTQLQNADLSQLDVNKAEAANNNIFVAGWRPWIGWVCGIAMAFQFVVKPLGIWLFSAIKPEYATMLLNAPGLDNQLWELLTGMLGLGALRSFEKIKGVVK